MRNKKCICFVVSNEARDFYITCPLMYFLEKKLNYDVRYEFVWNAIKIKFEKPDLVLLPNSRGHNLFFEISKYASENGIQVVALDSEGNFKTQEKFDFWGFNTDKRFYHDWHFTWSHRTRNFLLEHYPMNPEKTKVTGAIGFDKYQILRFKDKKRVLQKFNKEQYTKVVGYAGWAFGKIFTFELERMIKGCGKSKEWLEEQRDQITHILEENIKKHSDTLFILKKHPRENFEDDVRDTPNEMNPLKDYPNVLYIKDEEEIQNIISISDLWLAFESTSIIEATIMGKPCAMINPDPDFNRTPIHKMCIKIKTSRDLEEAIQKSIEQDKKYFNPPEVVTHQKEIIENSIGFTDGLNHLRTMYYVTQLLQDNKSPQRVKWNFKFLRLYVLLHLGKYFYIKSLFKKLPKFKKTLWIFDNYKLKELKQMKESYYKDLDHFYDTHQLNELIDNKLNWKSILD